LDNLILDVRNVTYSVNGLTFLDDISFDLRQGNNLLVFGPESSGITSLSGLVLRTDSEYEGEVLYKGNSLKDLDYFGQLMHKKDIGYVHGDYGLISNMNVEQNISLPLEYHSKMTGPEIKKHVGKIIYDLNLDHCRKLRPFDLTRSEILKTSFARALAMDPDLLYIEYAFEDQCPLNIKTMMNILSERSHLPDKSLIIITYYPWNFIDISDSFIMFFNGRIVFSGGRDDFLNSSNPYLLQYKNKSIEGPMVIL
jgi:ABC-type transporter Mla maintaining outer membrane lipid asymmetry ATPase subunit MlaF